MGNIPTQKKTKKEKQREKAQKHTQQNRSVIFIMVVLFVF